MIPINEPLFISDEKKYLAKCIDSGRISSDGFFVKEFEEKFSEYIGTKYGIAVSSGTSALEVATGVIDIKRGDEVIMPTFTFISCASAVVAYGAVPVFVDSEPETFNIDPAKIEEKITKKTKAIIIVHTYGHPANMDEILSIAKKYNLKVIEDCAEAHGAEYGSAGLRHSKWKKCGGLGDISCFSFHESKIINTGEGGMILTNDVKYFDKARFLRNLGFIDKKKYYHTELTKNYRMTNIQAAIGVAQLKNIGKLLKIKIDNAKKYTDFFKNVEYLQLPVEKSWAKNVYWVYAIVLDESSGYNAISFAKKLSQKGIQTRPFFYSLHLQPFWKKINIKIKKGNYPIAERITKQGLYLPSGLALKEQQIKEVCDTIKYLLK